MLGYTRHMDKWLRHRPQTSIGLMRHLARCFVLSVICFHCLSLTAAVVDEQQHKFRLKIMPLGDSITEGYSSRDSYRWHLWRLMQQSGFDVDFVGSVRPQALTDNEFDADHEGHWGFLASQILRGLPRWLAANTPDIVLLHIGTNDIGSCSGPNETAKTTQQIIDLIQDHNQNTIILLAKIVPIDFDGQCDSGKSIDEMVRQLNQRLEVISTDKPDIVIVDLYSALDAKSDFRDMVHPNTQGFKKMAEGWFQALEPILAAQAGPS